MVHLQVCHLSEGRIRLRTVGGHPVEETFFEELREALGALGAVREVRTNARTGSVLVLHEGGAEPLLDALSALAHVAIAPPKERTPMLRLQSAVRQAEARVARRTHGTITLGSLSFALMTVAGFWQTGRGHLFPAGMTLLEYAFQAMNREAERERAASRPRG